MKNTLLFIFAIYTQIIFSQTIDIEKANLDKRYQSGGITQLEYQELGKNWREVIKSLGGYPDLPYDTISNEIEFEFIKTFPSLDKKTIYNRIMEYSALSFGSIDAVLHYSNLETGKIIIKGWFELIHMADIPNFWGEKKEVIKKEKCYFTYLYTIKDGKLKIQIVNLNYKYTVDGYISSSIYIPTRDEEFSIRTLYPITSADPMLWKARLDILKQTNIKIKSLTDRLTTYIINKDYDYGF